MTKKYSSIESLFFHLKFNNSFLYRDGNDEEKHDSMVQFLKTTIVFTTTTCVPVAYVLFGVGYRILFGNTYLFYFYVMVVFGVLREVLFLIVNYAWDKVDESGYILGESWVFLNHGKNNFLV